MFVKEITNNRIVLETPAKLNLFLQVLNKRDDGYHNINSLFQAVSLFDRLEFELSDTPDVVITLANERKLPLDSNNLIARAYDIMQREFSLRQGLRVLLEKRIPIAAGLAGGSSAGITDPDIF